MYVYNMRYNKNKTTSAGVIKMRKKEHIKYK